MGEGRIGSSEDGFGLIHRGIALGTLCVVDESAAERLYDDHIPSSSRGRSEMMVIWGNGDVENSGPRGQFYGPSAVTAGHFTATGSHSTSTVHLPAILPPLALLLVDTCALLLFSQRRDWRTPAVPNKNSPDHGR